MGLFDKLRSVFAKTQRTTFPVADWLAMPGSAKVQFEPKWKEELICTMDAKRFTIELTMGVLTVYFPTRSKWETIAPDWAKPHWERVKNDLATWCLQQAIPLHIDDNAWVAFQ